MLMHGVLLAYKVFYFQFHHIFDTNILFYDLVLSMKYPNSFRSYIDKSIFAVKSLLANTIWEVNIIINQIEIADTFLW